MNTINYLTSIINLLQKTPQAQEIIDTQGLGQELTFGQIGIKDATALKALRSRPFMNARQTPIVNISSNSSPR